MYHNGFIKVAAVTPKLEVGNPQYNVQEMLTILKTVHSSITVFPELGITAYTCNDLFFQNSLLEEARTAMKTLMANNTYQGILVVGAPLEIDGILYNCAFVIQGNKLLGIVPKFYLPNTQEYYEKRWFTTGFDIVKTVKEIKYLGQKVPFGSIVFRSNDDQISFGVEICEDMWAPLSPGNILALNGAKIILNLSASNEYLYKREVRQRTILEHSRRNAGAYVYSSAGVNESTSETVFSGHNIICQNGEILRETENFSQSSEVIYGDIDLSKINYARKTFSSFRDTINKYEHSVITVHFDLTIDKDYAFETPIDQTPFVPKTQKIKAFEKVAALQENALIKRMKHIQASHIVVGVSGGLDSTLALFIAARVIKNIGKSSQEIIAVTMPAFGTSDTSLSNARQLMKALNVTEKEIDISQSVNEHFDLIGHDRKTLDKTYENAQARTRTLILMDLANMHNGIVLGTGDMSELALGWTTYNGDQMSMYGINAGVPKTLVKFMVEYYAKECFDAHIVSIVQSILATPISPELLKDQKTEDAIGKYEVNDFILHRYLRFGDSEDRIEWLLSKTFDLSDVECKSYVRNFFNRFYSQQFKRQASPDSPKILDVSLSPRGDLRMPSDVSRRIK